MMILHTGWQRFRYWKNMIGFRNAYYKIRNEIRYPVQGIAMICAEQNCLKSMPENGEWLLPKVSK